MNKNKLFNLKQIIDPNYIIPSIIKKLHPNLKSDDYIKYCENAAFLDNRSSVC